MLARHKFNHFIILHVIFVMFYHSHDKSNPKTTNYITKQIKQIKFQQNKVLTLLISFTLRSSFIVPSVLILVIVSIVLIVSIVSIVLFVLIVLSFISFPDASFHFSCLFSFVFFPFYVHCCFLCCYFCLFLFSFFPCVAYQEPPVAARGKGIVPTFRVSYLVAI